MRDAAGRADRVEQRDGLARLPAHHHRTEQRAGGGRCRNRRAVACRRSARNGADAVLVNTAIAVAQDPVAMARAFRLAVEAGRTAFEAKLAPVSSAAHATSPIQPLLDDVLSLK